MRFTLLEDPCYQFLVLNSKPSRGGVGDLSPQDFHQPINVKSLEWSARGLCIFSGAGRWELEP